MKQKRTGLFPLLTPLVVLASIAVVVFGFVYQVVENPNLQGCALFGASPRFTLSAIVLIALLGWLVALHQVLPRLFEAYFRPTVVGRAEASDADLLTAIKSGASLDIFGSSSERLRSLLHVHCRSLPKDLKIRVLLREDETPGRRAKLEDQATKWKSEIAPCIGSVQLRTYNFNPLMFRGVIIDGHKAILGWYYRGNPLRQGEELDWFWIYHADSIKAVSAAFEDMFARGGQI